MDLATDSVSGPSFRVATAVDKADCDRGVEELLQAIPEVPDPSDFLSLVDRAKERIGDILLTSYPSDGFVKLVTLKICNLVVAAYHHHHRHLRLASRPIQLMLDPANNCQLQCPGCVHTGNPVAKANFIWPGGLLDSQTYESFLSRYGPFGFGVVFYNYGEPLLNKQTPQFIRRSKDYLLSAVMSSNLSVKMDPDALVLSGLNCLYLSFDGATQETYSRYRRRGDLSLCFENVRKIVEARKRHGSPVPYLEWKYLTFEHNVHEVDLALDIARDLGVDEIHFATPFAVDWDDPEIRVTTSDRQGRHKFHGDIAAKGPLDDYSAFGPASEEIERLFAQPWSKRVPASGETETSRPTSSTCEWLYQSTTIDAGGRVSPCCMPPQVGVRRVYGTFPEIDAFNGDDMVLSRLAFADRQSFESRAPSLDNAEVPFCSICKANPELTYAVDQQVFYDLSPLYSKGFLSLPTLEALSRWGKSRGG